MTKKLTLSADEKVIRKAKRLASRQGTSVSAIFSRVIRSMADEGEAPGDVPPDSIAARATGFIALPQGKTADDILAEALIQKHGAEGLP